MQGRAEIPLTAARGVATWPFWQLPRRLRAYIGLLVVAAAVLAVYLGWREPPTIRQFGILGMFLACGIVVAEASRGFLRGVATNFRQDLNSAWKLPVLILLPPFFAVIAPIFFVIYWQRSVRRSGHVHRRVFTIAMLAIGDTAGSLVFHALVRDGASILQWTAAALLAAVIARLGNMFLLGVVLRLTQPESVRGLFDRETLMYSGVEACVGVIVAMLATQQMLLIALAVPPVILLHRGLLHEQLRHMSRTDAKTAVLNAGAWEQDAETELSRAKKTRESTSVLICDIDHFKLVNDEHGHLAGDAALRTVAQRLQALLRQGDILGRFGGEEFVILLSGIGVVNAKSIAERLRRNVAADPIALESGTIRLTVSLGVATLESSDGTLAEMLAAADEALYAAKRRGRNRVVIARRLHAADAVAAGETVDAEPAVQFEVEPEEPRVAESRRAR